MIPRLKPYFNFQEIKAVFKFEKVSLKKFEEKFAQTFRAKYALAFPYGRSAIYTIFKALNIENSEIIVPAYTCVVVPHAVVLSGNVPRFVDTKSDDYNLDLDEAIKKINDKTKAIIPGNIFGYPVNLDKLEKIKQIKKDILIIQDCAHCFDAEFQGKSICNQGDLAIFGLNISKQISSVFGGMLTTNNKELYQKIKEYRDKHFKKPSFLRSFKKLIYLLITYPAFTKFFYNFVSFFDYVENKKILKKFTQYYQEKKIDLPKDAFEMISPLEARVGLIQLKKYSEIREKRIKIAQFYNDNLKNIPELTLPLIVRGATYSHYVPRVKNRKKIVKEMKKQGIQLGTLIEYSIPHMKAYQKYKDEEFKNSLNFSQTVINLPIYPNLEKKDLIKITNRIKQIYEN